MYNNLCIDIYFNIMNGVAENVANGSFPQSVWAFTLNKLEANIGILES